MLLLSVLVCGGGSFLIIILFAHIPIISYNVSNCHIRKKHIWGGGQIATTAPFIVNDCRLFKIDYVQNIIIFAV